MQKDFSNQGSLTANCYVNYKELMDESELSAPEKNYVTLVFFEKGTGALTIELVSYLIKPGQVHILVPGKVYDWTWNPGIVASQLTISKDLLETFPPFFQFIFNQYNQNPVFDLDPTTFRKIIIECLAIKDELDSKTVSLDLVNARCLLIILIISLWRSGERADMLTGNANSIIQAFQSLLEKNFRTYKTVTFYAEKLCITPNYLGIICRKSLNMSALEVIQQRILHEAKQLLHSSGKSVKEISFDLGFPKLTYFSYFFKAKTNFTPVEYRRLADRSLKLII